MSQSCSILSLIFAGRMKPALRIPVLGPGGADEASSPGCRTCSLKVPLLSLVSPLGALPWTGSQCSACRGVRAAAELVRKPGASGELLGVPASLLGAPSPADRPCPAPLSLPWSYPAHRGAPRCGSCHSVLEQVTPTSPPSP